MGAVPFTALKASTIILNRTQAAPGSQWRSQRRGVTWENLSRFKIRIRCNGLVAEAGSPAKSGLQ